MSGGHFQFDQYKIGYISDEIEQLIYNNDSTEKDEYGYEKGHHYSEETIKLFKEAMSILKKAQIMAHRIDWLVSGDDGEDSFIERWKEDLAKIGEYNENKSGVKSDN